MHNTDRERLDAATKQLNEGEQIPEVEAAWIEHLWETTNRISREQRQHTAIELGAIADPNAPQIDPENQVALLARFMMLDALIERGILDEYIRDKSERKKLFAAAASISCDKNDLGEALAQKHLREMAPDLAEKTKEELRLAGCDPDQTNIGKKFIEWLRDNY